MKGIILAGGPAQIGLQNIFGNIPAALVPINGKPSIEYVIHNMLEYGVKEFVITVDHHADKIKRVVEKIQFQENSVEFIEVPCKLKPGSAVNYALNHLEDGPVLICLSDSVVKITDKAFDKAFIAVAPVNYHSHKWCGVRMDQNGDFLGFEDKNAVKTPTVACGMYYLPNFSKFHIKKSLDQEISEVILNQLDGERLIILKASFWWDLGHIDGYFHAKSDSLNCRVFNNLEVDEFLGTIKKTSTHIEKFRDEILWQVNLPRYLQPLVPRVLDYCADSETDNFIVSEYYGYPNIADIWLFPQENPEHFKKIVDKCLEVLNYFMKFKKTVNDSNYYNVYIQKTLERISTARSNSAEIKALFDIERININGESYMGWPKLKHHILGLANKLYNKDHNCLIHGDFCLSNILYDSNTNIIRLIDPRGRWGGSIGGDIKYDLAKLRHSICGGYDFIIADMFDFWRCKDSINFRIFCDDVHLELGNYFDNQISKKFNLESIKLIEGLLFLSMIPLHSDFPRRQKAMFTNAIMILNEI
jgi:dTDP-glucose pyrophosphorylase